MTLYKIIKILLAVGPPLTTLNLKLKKKYKTTNQSKHQIKSTAKPPIKKPMIFTIGFK